MTSQFVSRKSREFFRGKKAIVTTEQQNLGGEIIKKDEVVTILCKNQRSKDDLDIESESGVKISGVWCEYLELVK